MEYASVADMAQEFAQGAVDIAREFEVELDYSEESLERVESILARLHDELRGGPPGVSSAEAVGPPADQMEMMCKLWGGYFGEVVRRRWGGEWSVETYPGALFATLTLTIGSSKLFPSIKVYRRLTEGEPDNIWKFYQAVREKLAALPGAAVQ